MTIRGARNGQAWANFDRGQRDCLNRDQMVESAPGSALRTQVRPDEDDDHTLLVRYPAASPADAYVRPAINIEFRREVGARPQHGPDHSNLRDRRRARSRSARGERHNGRAWTDILGQGGDPSRLAPSVCLPPKTRDGPEEEWEAQGNEAETFDDHPSEAPSSPWVLSADELAYLT